MSYYVPLRTPPPPPPNVRTLVLHDGNHGAPML